MSDDSKFLESGALENILIGAYDAFVKENVEVRAKAGHGKHHKGSHWWML